VSEEARGRCYGRLDVGLSENGRQQSRRVAELLAGEAVTAVVCSPAGRTRETAAAVAARHELGVTVLEELSELDFGELEGRTYEEIEVTWPDLYAAWMTEPASVAFPGGEALADLRARVSAAVMRLRALYDGSVVVAITHAGVVRTVLADALGIPDDRIFRLDIGPASITRVEWRDGVAVVRVVNSQTQGRADRPLVSGFGVDG
jgi:alpha-ribazole phosphatase